MKFNTLSNQAYAKNKTDFNYNPKRLASLNPAKIPAKAPNDPKRTEETEKTLPPQSTGK